MEININTWKQLERDIGEEIMPVIVQQFISEISQRSENLSNAVKSNDIGAIGEEAHTIKSTSKTVGLDQIAECAAETESLARDGQSTSVAMAEKLAALCQVGVDCLTEKLTSQAE